jgi:spermidine synthase
MTRARVVARLTTRQGELVLRSDGDAFEIVANGMFLMDTRDGRSERLLVRAALDACAHPERVAILGLGVGYSLAEAVADRVPREITVVEREPAVLDWQRAYLGERIGRPLDDSRVVPVLADARAWLSRARDLDVICLDTDNGPDWLVTEDNAELYSAGGLAAIAAALRPGGVAAFWSAHDAPGFVASLAAVFDEVTTRTVPVGRGAPDVVYIAARPVPAAPGGSSVTPTRRAVRAMRS